MDKIPNFVNPAPLPPWAQEPFDYFWRYESDAARILALCIRGVTTVSHIPRIINILDHGKVRDEAAYVSNQFDAEFAKQEIKDDFSALHSHSVVTIWGALEVLVNDLATAWLINQPEALNRATVSKIRIPLSEYERLNKDERMRFLVKDITRSLNADFKMGVDKFEVVLDALGLGGAVNKNRKKILYEVSQVRNILVHRAGIVDRQFKEGCPWVKTPLGSKFKINPKLYNRYHNEVWRYTFDLNARVRNRLGIEPIPRAQPGELVQISKGLFIGKGR